MGDEAMIESSMILHRDPLNQLIGLVIFLFRQHPF